MILNIKFDDKEVQAMVNKLSKRDYSKVQMASAGIKMVTAYDKFLELKKMSKVPENQMTLDEIIDIMKK